MWLHSMRQALLGVEFEGLPMDVYLTQTSLVDHRFSARLNLMPFGEDAILLGGHLSVRLDGKRVADLTLRPPPCSTIRKDQGDRLPLQVELPATCDPSCCTLSVSGYVLFSKAHSGAHYRCALAPDGSIEVEQVAAVKGRLLRWVGALRDFFNAPLD